MILSRFRAIASCTCCLLILFLCLFSRKSDAAESITYKEVCPGVSYGHFTRTNPLSIHVVKFEYRRPELWLSTTLAKRSVFGLEKVRDEVAALPKKKGKAVAAINGDFFVMDKDPYQGDPRGLQILNGELVSSPNNQSCFWIDADGKPQMGVVAPEFNVRWPDGTQTPFAINEKHFPTNAALLTPRLGKSTRMTNSVELVLERDGGQWLPLRVNESYAARVREVRLQGDTPLNPDIMVLSLGTTLAQTLSVKSGMRLQISTAVSPSLKGVRTAIGGKPELVRGGISLHEQKSKVIHPRTAIGWNEKYMYLVAVDGRQKRLSLGVDYCELAEIMSELGCKQALNLDGGGSTTLWLDGKVVNSPSDKNERAVANALVLIRK